MDFVLVFERKDKTCDISSSKSCYYVYERLGVWTMAHTGWFFWLVRPIFSTKMKNDGQPIRDSVPWNSRCTKDPHWLNNIFLFSTEIWAEQLKKPPCILYISVESLIALNCKCKCKWLLRTHVIPVGSSELAQGRAGREPERWRSENKRRHGAQPEKRKQLDFV